MKNGIIEQVQREPVPPPVIGLFITSIFMLRWSIIFIVIAIVAAIFGFGGVAETATDIAKILFFVFIALFILSFIFGLIGSRKGKDRFKE